MKKWASKLWLPVALAALGVDATLLLPRLRNFANLNKDNIEHLKNLGELVAIPVGAL